MGIFISAIRWHNALPRNTLPLPASNWFPELLPARWAAPHYGVPCVYLMRSSRDVANEYSIRSSVGPTVATSITVTRVKIFAAADSAHYPALKSLSRGGDDIFRLTSLKSRVFCHCWVSAFPIGNPNLRVKPTHYRRIIRASALTISAFSKSVLAFLRALLVSFLVLWCTHLAHRFYLYSFIFMPYCSKNVRPLSANP